MVENPAPLIEAQGVTKRYGSVAALNDVSLTVTARAVGLLGANGAGKSTLMKTMLGLISPDAGHVRVHGCRFGRPGLGRPPPAGVHARALLPADGDDRA